MRAPRNVPGFVEMHRILTAPDRYIDVLFEVERRIGAGRKAGSPQVPEKLVAGGIAELNVEITLRQAVRARQELTLEDMCHVASLPYRKATIANGRAPGIPRAFPIVRHYCSMTRIRASAVVHYTAEHLDHLLGKYMDERRRGDGSINLPLRVHLGETRRDALSIDHDIVMRFRRGPDPQGLNDTFYVDWAPTGGGPYPTFTGFMNVCSEDDPRLSRIEIDGTYIPPGGLLGRLFDASIGKRIAQASLTDFVDRLAADITPAFSSYTRM